MIRKRKLLGEERFNHKVIMGKGDVITIRATQTTYFKYAGREVELVSLDNKETK